MTAPMVQRGKKSVKTQIEVDSGASSLASAWLDEMAAAPGAAKAHESEDEGEPADASEPRPARLGLGAKFIPHSAALNTRDTGAEGAC